MKAGAQYGERNLLLPTPAGERLESGVDPNLFAQQPLSLGERLADAAHLGGDAVAQTQLALSDQPPDGFDHPRASPQTRRHKDQRVRFSDCAVEIGEDVWFCHSAPSVVYDFDARRSLERELRGRHRNVLLYVREDEVGTIAVRFDD